jgi:hypothetical protein
MTPFDRELKSALARREPPAGFTDRVMARVPQRSKRRWSHSWMAAAAAGLIALIGGGAYEFQRTNQVRVEGERAKAELVFALEVASQKLQHTKAKVLKNSEERL